MLQEAQQGEHRDRKRPSARLSAPRQMRISSYPPPHHPETFTKTRHFVFSRNQQDGNARQQEALEHLSSPSSPPLRFHLTISTHHTTGFKNI